MNFITNHIYKLQMSFVLLIGILFIFGSTYFGELIPTNNGLGYDGKHYASLAINYPDSILKVSDSKYLQRSLPSLVVYSITKALQLSPSNEHVILIFSIYNLLILLVAVHFWNKISNLFNFNVYGNYIGFFALFLSFASLKFTFFYPTLTDITGFCLSILLLYYYKLNNKLAILVIMLLSAGSWPAIEYICLAILFFKQREIIPEVKSIRLNQLIAFMIVLGFVSIAGYLIYRHPNMRGGWQEHTYIVKNGILFSLAATFLVMFFSIKKLIERIQLKPNAVLNSIDYKFGIAGIILFIVIDFAIKIISKHYHIAPGYSIKMYLNDILIIGSRQPFCFILGHLIYFGPILAICIFRWQKICSAIFKEGWAMFFIIVQLLFFMLDSESRHILHYIPFLVLLLIQTFNKSFNKSILLTTFLLSFLCSKIWVSIFKFPFSEWSENYNMNFGCYFTDNVYLLQLLIFACISLILYFKIKKNESAVSD